MSEKSTLMSVKSTLKLILLTLKLILPTLKLILWTLKLIFPTLKLILPTLKLILPTLKLAKRKEKKSQSGTRKLPYVSDVFLIQIVSVKFDIRNNLKCHIVLYTSLNNIL